MTGSGKSEMVQSWILSMALRFSPKDVSFVLIDFKGTGLLLYTILIQKLLSSGKLILQGQQISLYLAYICNWPNLGCVCHIADPEACRGGG